MNESLYDLLKGLLTKNSIKVDNTELRLQLLGHPSYPSLHSITGVLDHFRIPNLAIEIPQTEENISLLPDYFIAHVKNKKNDDFVLVNKKGQELRVQYEGGKKELISVSNFIDIWTGIVLVIESDENVKSDSSINFSKILLTLSPILLAACFMFFSQNINISIHFVLSMLGLTTCALIIQHELGVSSAVLNKICSGTSDKLSCNDVMESKGAKFFGFLKLSDLGIIYFLTMSLSSLLLLIGKEDFVSLYLISIVVLPFTLYSIYYQFRIVKKWCLLCLSVVLVLWMQSGLAFLATNPTSNFKFSLSPYLLVALSVYLTSILWIFIAPLLRKEQAYFKLKIQNHKFKRNFEIFNNLLSRSQPINTQLPDTNEIVFGDLNSELEIVVVTNPMCGFCKNAHKLIHMSLDHEVNVKIIVRFNISSNPEALDTRIASKLIENFHLKGAQMCLKAMDGVYGNGPKSDWLNKWGETQNENYDYILINEKKWCLDKNILFTPVVLINGKSYPPEYDFEDLEYFLDDLCEKEERVHTELVVD
ncbi:cysteine peptidase family C39 domain-containing protein [Ancylomarina sp. DW003]|nr:vitamin K epoxide reductase family protein [Ancylomarina sp. DW003]MDE5421648.1 cysteine peptidase family C39 domain-containing protein [Ancylomarina sp. DW003]